MTLWDWHKKKKLSFHYILLHFLSNQTEQGKEDLAKKGKRETYHLSWEFWIEQWRVRERKCKSKLVANGKPFSWVERDLCTSQRVWKWILPFHMLNWRSGKNHRFFFLFFSIKIYFSSIYTEHWLLLLY